MTAIAPAVAPATTDPWVFHDGDIIRASEVALTASTQVLHYGTGVFEGIRSYRSDIETEVSLLFRARDHYRRLLASAALLRIDVPHTADDLVDITVDLMQRNALTVDAYVRPIAYKLRLEPGTPAGVRLRAVTSCLSILTMPMPQYARPAGIRCGVSSWRRIPDAALPARAKISGAYANNALAVDEVTAAGFDDAILLNTRGQVSEAATSNVFLVRGGVLITPDVAADILEGITRDTVRNLAEQSGTRVVERSVARSELYTADEIFLTGTGCEVVAVVEVDGRTVGNGEVGPITRAVRDSYDDLVRGRSIGSAETTTRIDFGTYERTRG